MPCKIELLSCRSVGEGCQPEEASAGSLQSLGDQIPECIEYSDSSSAVIGVLARCSFAR